MRCLKDEGGVVPLPVVTKTLAGFTVVVAFVQALGDPSTSSTIQIDTWELLKWLITGLVVLVFWFVRRTFNEHERRISTLEQSENRDIERLEGLVRTLDRTVLALSVLCPYCKQDKLEPPADPIEDG